MCSTEELKCSGGKLPKIGREGIDAVVFHRPVRKKKIIYQITFILFCFLKICENKVLCINGRNKISVERCSLTVRQMK